MRHRTSLLPADVYRGVVARHLRAATRPRAGREAGGAIVVVLVGRRHHLAAVARLRVNARVVRLVSKFSRTTLFYMGQKCGSFLL